MAKKKTTPKTERTIYCSGQNWEGDGSKKTSSCPFGYSIVSTAERYKCSHCTTKQLPRDILSGLRINTEEL